MTTEQARRIGEVFHARRVNFVCEVFACPPAYPELAAEERESVGGDGSADMVICDRCMLLVTAHHVMQIRLRFGQAGEVTSLCGRCLDALTEQLYTACARDGVAHWRKKHGGTR